MDLWVSCHNETLCVALPCKRRATGALLQLHPRLGQSLCVGDGYEHSVSARPCRCVCGWWRWWWWGTKLDSPSMATMRQLALCRAAWVNRDVPTQALGGLHLVTV